ncbi:MAG TPA: TlpA disulfide reductase family protein [Planctomycetota bacterium]|nr:TlpA disulfide reductase family protein [Planctomycetota bacterium]
MRKVLETRAPRIAAWLLPLSLAAGPGCGAGEEAGPPRGPRAEPAAATSVEIVDLAGLEAALARQRGRGVLLNFWAIWCPPCVAELPELVETSREFQGEGGVVLAVSYDLMVPEATPEGTLEAVKRFASQRDIGVPILIFDGPDYDAINERFDLPGPIPVTLAIDREGRIVDRELGRADRARFDELMRKALAR